MQDDKIVALYWQRDDAAIRETEKKYGKYLLKIAQNILFDFEDSKESVNDTYLKAWNSIPPHKPMVLSTYLGKIARERSIDLLRRKKRAKRQPSEYVLSLSELKECISDSNTTEQEVDMHLLADAIGTYLKTLSKEARTTFVGRYYYMDSIREIAAWHGISESKTKSMLHRTRQGLKEYLTREGFL